MRGKRRGNAEEGRGEEEREEGGGGGGGGGGGEGKRRRVWREGKREWKDRGKLDTHDT